MLKTFRTIARSIRGADMELLNSDELRLAAEIVIYMRNKPNLTTKQIAKTFCINHSDADRILNHLRRMNSANEKYKFDEGYVWNV